MPNTFLDDLYIYNPKAAAAIAEAVLECDNDKANMMSGLKTTANDVTLSDEIRLDALTALINLGNLLDVALPPYFPSTVTYKNTQEYVGIHNSLEGLQGGSPGEYYHLTQAEKDGVLNKASIADITWDNLTGSYSDNEAFALLFDNKQEQLSAPAAGEFYIKINGTTIIYDNTPTIGNITGIVAGGELSGTYPNPTIQNVAVINKVLTGFDGNAPTGTILPTDSILIAFQKLNANINNVINSPSGVSSVSYTTTAGGIFTTSSTNTGAVTLSLGLQNQNANLFLASPNAASGQPIFRALVNADLPNSGVAANTYGSASFIPRITVNSKGVITGVIEVANPSGGQVNSISIAAPGFLSGSSINSVVPATPIINLSFSQQTANTVFAGPATGAAIVPSFRALVVDDIPQLPTSKIDGLNIITDSFLTDDLGTSLMYIGNGSNKAVQSEVGGDLSAIYSLINNTQTAVFTINNEAVTYDKFQNIPDSALTLQRPILLGRFDAGQGVMQQMTLSGDFTINTTTGVIGLQSPNPPSLVDVGDLLTSTGSNNLVRLSLPSPNDGYLLMPYAAASSPACGLIWGEVQGDITYTVDDTTTPGTPFGAFSIGANKVTFSQIQQLPQYTVIGNATNATANATALTKTQLTTLVEQFTIDTAGGNTGLKGVVPGFNINGLPAGKTAADYFLNAAGGWALGGGGSGSGTVLSGGPNQLAYYSTLGTVVQGWASSSSLIYSDTSGAIQNLVYTGQNGLYLKVGVSGLLEWASAGSGSGTVVSGTVNQVAYYSASTSVSSTTIAGTDGTKILSQVVTAGAGATPSWLSVTGTGNVVLDTSPTMDSPYIGTTATTGHIHFRKAASSIPSGFSNTATLWFPETGGNKRMAIMWDNLGYSSQFQLNATGDQTYTFPNATGEVALISVSRTLTISSSGGSAGKIVLGGGSSGTITIQASPTGTVSGTYTLPLTAPVSGTNNYLTSNTSGDLTWTQITGGGDVSSNTSSTTTGNFAVFADNSGKLIGESNVASLTNTGTATFNQGVNIGVSNTITGNLVFRSISNAFTTTIRQGVSTFDLTYTLPSGPLAAGRILSTDANGNLSWVAAGAGDMVLATSGQIVTGSKIYRDDTLLASNIAQSFNTTISAGTSTANRKVTLPDVTGTLAALNLAQTYTATQTFSSNLTVSGGTLTTNANIPSVFNGTITSGLAGTTSQAQFVINGSTMNYIDISATGAADPISGTTISAGTKLLFRKAATAATLTTSIGIDANSSLWLASGYSATAAAQKIGFWLPSGASGAAEEVAKFGQMAGTAGWGLVFTRTSAAIEINQSTTTAATFIDFRGFPSGTITPNGVGYTLGSGTRIVLYKPGTAYSTTIGYYNGGGVFVGLGLNSGARRFGIFGDNVEAAVITVSTTSATLSLINSAGTLQQVVGSRKTGWVTPLATPSRVALPATPTVAELSAFCAALYQDLASTSGHGLIN